MLAGDFLMCPLAIKPPLGLGVVPSSLVSAHFEAKLLSKPGMNSLFCRISRKNVKPNKLQNTVQSVPLLHTLHVISFTGAFPRSRNASDQHLGEKTWVGEYASYVCVTWKCTRFSLCVFILEVRVWEQVRVTNHLKDKVLGESYPVCADCVHQRLWHASVWVWADSEVDQVIYITDTYVQRLLTEK